MSVGRAAAMMALAALFMGAALMASQANSTSANSQGICNAAAVNIMIGKAFYGELQSLGPFIYPNSTLSMALSLNYKAETYLNESNCQAALNYSVEAINMERSIFYSIIKNPPNSEPELFCPLNIGIAYAYLNYAKEIGTRLGNASLVLSASNALRSASCNESFIAKAREIYLMAYSEAIASYNSSIYGITAKLLGKFIADNSTGSLRSVTYIIKSQYGKAAEAAVMASMKGLINYLNVTFSEYLSSGNIVGLASMNGKAKLLASLIGLARQAGINASQYSSELNSIYNYINSSRDIEGNGLNETQLQQVENELRLLTKIGHGGLRSLWLNVSSQFNVASAMMNLSNYEAFIESLRESQGVSSNIVGVPIPEPMREELSRMFNITIGNASLAYQYLNLCGNYLNELKQSIEDNSTLVEIAYYSWRVHVYCPMAFNYLMLTKLDLALIERMRANHLGSSGNSTSSMPG
ncbi:hypothetical protein [Thermocladium modestius]|nr:hypothetical protein [Thermocladium modestius]